MSRVLVVTNDFPTRRGGIESFVLALCERTTYVNDDSLPFPRSFPGWLFITLKDGRRLEARMDASRGSRENPMSNADVREKFEANARRALPAAQVQRLWDEGLALEKAADVRQFTKLLVN